MAGNLQVFAGPEKLNKYAEFLQSLGGGLWAARLILLGAVALHIVSAVQLYNNKSQARPQGYVKKATIATSYAARTMVWSGPIILFFLIYHLLHFTTGQATRLVKAMSTAMSSSGSVILPPLSSTWWPMFCLPSTSITASGACFRLWVSTTPVTPPLCAIREVVRVHCRGSNVSMPLAVLAGIVKL